MGSPIDRPHNSLYFYLIIDRPFCKETEKDHDHSLAPDMGLHCFLISQKYSVGINDYDQQMYLKAAHWVVHVSYISVSKRKIEHALICSDILLKTHAYLERRVDQ